MCAPLRALQQPLHAIFTRAHHVWQPAAEAVRQRLHRRAVALLARRVLCMFQNTSERGAFGDALAEVDWLVGNVIEALESNGIAENTLTLFTGVCLSFSVYPEVAMVHSKLTCLVIQVIMARG